MLKIFAIFYHEERVQFRETKSQKLHFGRVSFHLFLSERATPRFTFTFHFGKRCHCVRQNPSCRRLYSTLAFPFPLFTRWARQNHLILNPSLSLFLAMEEDKYAKELEVAVRVVHVACALCERVQERLLETTNDHVVSKDDDSPVTVAGIVFNFNFNADKFRFFLFS